MAASSLLRGERVWNAILTTKYIWNNRQVSGLSPDLGCIFPASTQIPTLSFGKDGPPGPSKRQSKFNNPTLAAQGWATPHPSTPKDAAPTLNFQPFSIRCIASVVSSDRRGHVLEKIPRRVGHPPSGTVTRFKRVTSPTALVRRRPSRC